MSEHNLVVLRGALAGAPQARVLASGQAVVQFDVTTRDDAGTQTVPVAWFEPPPAGLPVEQGEDLVVVGSVRRRFFRASGSTQSRTEVVAERVLAAGRRRDVGRALESARQWLQ